MCHYITAALPGGTDLAALAPVADAHGIALEPIENASVRPHLDAGARYVVTTRGSCDCGTELGSMARSGGGASAPGWLEREAAKLRKKGWGERKVERWLADKRRAEEQRARTRADRGRAPSNDAQRWLDALRALTAQGLPWIALLVHCYRGGLTGRIAIARVESLPLDGVTARTLLELEEDVLYRFVAAASTARRRDP